MKIIKLNPRLTNERIVELIREARFKEEAFCPHCASPAMKWGKHPEKGYVQRYRCKLCGSTFSDLSGTPMENSKMKTREWVLIAYLFFKLHLSISE